MSAKTYQQRSNSFTQFLQVIRIKGSNAFVREPRRVFLGEDLKWTVWIIRHVEIELYRARSAKVKETTGELTKVLKVNTRDRCRSLGRSSGGAATMKEVQ